MTPVLSPRIRRSKAARAVPVAVGVAAALVPVTNAFAAPAGATAATPAKKVTTTTKTYTGPSVEADRWGPVQVVITVKTTTTTVGTKKTVARKIVKISTPIYPDHTDRSLYISQQAIPVLFQEVLTAQSASIDMVSRATDTSQAFIQSLQGALTQAKLASAAATSSAAAGQAA